ncbi:cystatin C (amyloid angiopathy and cerebral hemorrhage) [Nematolebias whitei]|uniref:cystatin C (amyloid angiopathy and cerebral hemorrhage) n=1 Tax=Nematolebias whitei TaxID=451745 RepID=UPI0018998302|nr:cystatin C (amyloid angiopathy and cerebral hemorrhage) [Nematolebias whitei]
MWKIVLLFLAPLFAAGLGGMTGGKQDIDVNDQGVQNALNFAVVEHNKASNDLFYVKNMEVLKAQSQVVAGVKYYIKVKMATTTCKKGSLYKGCPVHTDPAIAKNYICDFEVWSRPWLPDIQVMKSSCS